MQTYTGWRERKGFGVAGMDGPRTAAMIGGVVVFLIVTMLAPGLLLWVAPLMLLTGVLALVSVRGEPLMHIIRRRFAWWSAKRTGSASHRASQGRPAGSEWTLPGPLATTAVVNAADESGQPWGCVWDRRTGRLTASLLVAPTSPWLVEEGAADRWVGAWHQWLARLGYASTVVCVSVTVETSPAPPAALEAAVRPRMSPQAPPAATQVLEQILATAPTAAAQVSTRVTVTVDPAAATVRLDSLEEQLADFSRALTGLASSLLGCGLTVLRRATVADTVAWTRSAFDPLAADALTAADRDGLTWADARPVSGQEEWDRYRTDSGVSVSYGWDEAPRQAVTADVLARLISPGQYRKRVTMQYFPMPAAQAATQLDLQAQAATFRSQMKRKSGRDETARDLADRERAMRAAQEEARGAGLVEMQLFATVTTTDPESVPMATADLEHRAEESRIRLRRLYGGQAVGFAAGLSAGVVPQFLQGR